MRSKDLSGQDDEASGPSSWVDMMNNCEYIVCVQLFPHDSYQDPAHIKITLDIRRRLEREVDSVTSIRDSREGRGRDADPWISDIKVSVASVGAAIAIHRWLQQFADGVEVECVLVADPRAASVAYARWVRTQGTWYDPTVERSPEERCIINFPKACDVCAWPDVTNPLRPFLLSPTTLAKAGKREIFVVHAGFLVVTARVLEMFERLIPGEFDHGPAIINHRDAHSAQYFWIRPLTYTGGLAFAGSRGTPCPGCGRAEVYFPNDMKRDAHISGQWIVSSYGDSNANIAYIGEAPWAATRSEFVLRPPTRWLALSGGLFAALYNHGVKGLTWPDEGPLVSYNLSESAWEPQRRFADLFTGSKDKFLKAKPKSTWLL
jgi:hypothetical protein